MREKKNEGVELTGQRQSGGRRLVGSSGRLHLAGRDLEKDWTRGATKRLQRVRECIYCGAREDLSDEHIIPLGLNGSYVLPDSTCGRCAAITGSVEQKVLRGFMRDARAVAPMKTRRPKERPTELPLKVLKSGVWSEQLLPTAEHPGFLFLPILAPARYLYGGVQKVGISVDGWECLFFGMSPQDVGARLGITEMQISHEWDITSFGRMLAKIAFGFAVAQFGLDAVRGSEVLPIISGESDSLSELIGIGRLPSQDVPIGVVHRVKMTPFSHEDGRCALVAQINLFAASGAGGYEVVVKTWPPGTVQFVQA